MRNWNKPRIVPSLPGRESFEPTYEELKPNISLAHHTGIFGFWAYLWGIETYICQLSYRFFMGFWAYLWGIETAGSLAGFGKSSLVLSLPMRNWNKAPNIPLLPWYLVLSLPMRNWNRPAAGKWRQGLGFWAYLWGIETLLPAPSLANIALFWAYLWGIETVLRSPVWRPVRQVLSLPMRNWN